MRGISAVVYTSIFSLLPMVVHAQSFRNPLASSTVMALLKGFVLAVVYVGTPALVVFMVYSGFLFVSAQGNPQGLSKAKSNFVTAIIAGVILLSLWAMVELVGNTVAGLSSAALLVVFGIILLFIIKPKM